MVGIYIHNGKNNKIINCSFESFDTAIYANDSENLHLENININKCNNGINITRCIDSKFRNININNKNRIRNSSIFRKKLLYIMVSYYMRNLVSQYK